MSYGMVVIVVILLLVAVVGFVVWKKRAAIFTGKEKRGQLYFREDGKFLFRRLSVEDTFLIEKKNGNRVAAWLLAYQSQIPFAGGGGVKPNNVTISYARDIIFDPFNLLRGSQKPSAFDHDAQSPKGMPAEGSRAITKPWIRDIAESQTYTAQQESSRRMALTTQMALLGGAVLLMAVALIVIILVV